MTDPPEHDDDAIGTARLVAFVDAERAHAAAGSRTRERWLRQLAAEEARFAATLLDLAEQRDAVTLRTTAGRTHQGWLAGVGEDFLRVETSAGVVVLIRLGAVAAVRPQPGSHRPEAAGERSSHALSAPGSFDEALALAAADRPRVGLSCGPGDAITGQLRAAGADVLSIRPDGDRGAMIYVRLAAVTEAAIGYASTRDSG